MKTILCNEYFMLAFTFGVFYAAKIIQRRLGWVLFNPILVAIAVIIVFLLSMDIPYDTYHESAKMIDFWLKPAVVALGVPLYLQLSSIKRQFLPILASQMVGCIAGIVSVVIIAKVLGASDTVLMSLASKSVTTPIAMEVTQVLGGIPSLTAAIVVITGLIGAIIGFKTLSVGHVSNPGPRSIYGGCFSCHRYLCGHGSGPVCWGIRQSRAYSQRYPHGFAYPYGY